MNFPTKSRFSGAFRANPSRFAALLIVALTTLFGCSREPAPPTVVIYTSVDQVFAEEVLSAFSAKTGIRVLPRFDSEAGKTTGFLHQLRREAATPRCDVWWSSEAFGTIELAREDLFESYAPVSATDIPREWRDPQDRWIGYAARARVIAFNPERVRKDELPPTWEGYAASRWAGRLALANPQFGTTRGHIAALFAAWGDQRGRSFLEALRVGGARIADGNSHSVRMVANGEADVGWTDSDDVWVTQRHGSLIESIYPAIDVGGASLWIPCTVAIVRGAPHGEMARKLADFLVSAEAERLLAKSDSRNVPVREALRNELGLNGTAPVAPNFDAIADALPGAMRAAQEILLR